MDVLVPRLGAKAIAPTSLAVLTSMSMWLSCFVPSWVHAGPYDLLSPEVKRKIDEANKSLCFSTQEFVKTLKFLRETREIIFRENVSRKIAEQVAQGCTGSAERFAQFIVFLKNIGVSTRKSLEMALEFSASPPDVQKNFVEIFSKAYLAEFFDYDYARAMKLAFELSRDYVGDPAIAREDFINLSQFCKDAHKLDLPTHFCSEYAIKVAKLSQYYIDGVSKPFLDLFADLREKKDLKLDVKLTLEMAYGIVKHGPLASQNFYEAFKLATTELAFDRSAALEFALKMATHSHVGETPPFMQFTFGGISIGPTQQTKAFHGSPLESPTAQDKKVAADDSKTPWWMRGKKVPASSPNAADNSRVK